MNAVSQQQGLGVTLVYDYPPGYLVEALHAGLETYGINWWRYLHSRALTPASTQAERDFAALVQRLAAFWLRGNSYRDSHQSGSVGIGRAIDNSLNVLGVSGLKVVDAASFVTLPGGNTGVLASVVALRAADITAAGA
jgi:choline dehydrogenase-like flavoprotein